MAATEAANAPTDPAAAGGNLHTAFCFSYMKRGKSGRSGSVSEEKDDGGKDDGGKDDGAPAHPYENSIKAVATVRTVEEFWSTYNYLSRPNDLPNTTDYHFFRDGIKPTWEDSSNARGGKWIVRLPKGLASRYWEEIILAFIGAQFPGLPDHEICGVVLSVRYSEDILGVWNKNSADKELTDRIRDAIKRVLQLPRDAPMEYKPHQNSIQDKSSFRNTHVWKGGKSGDHRNHGDHDRHGHSRSNRSGSWGDRDKPRRESDRAWR